jgi:hypothetical protein
MAKQVGKRPSIVQTAESMVQKQTKKLMDAAKKEYERFEARAKTAKNEDQRQSFLSQAYGGLMMAGAMAHSLRDQVDRMRETYLQKKPSGKSVKAPAKKKSSRSLKKKATSTPKKTPSRTPRKVQAKKSAQSSTVKRRR